MDFWEVWPEIELREWIAKYYDLNYYQSVWEGGNGTRACGRHSLDRKTQARHPNSCYKKNTFRAPTFSDSAHGGSTISRDIGPPQADHLRILDGATYFFVTPMVRLKLFSKCLGGREWHEGMREKLSRPKNTSSSPSFVSQKNKI